jgi:hypothetical protein
MERRVALGLLLAALLVVAGCVTPAGTGTPTAATPASPTPAGGSSSGTPTATPAGGSSSGTPTVTPADFGSKVTVEGGSFAFDAAAVYRRVVALHGLPASAAPNVTVHVRNTSSVPLTAVYSPSRFERTMGVEPTTGETAIAGLARGTDVYVYVGTVATADEREATLAHEYVHVLQSATGVFGDVAEGVDGRQTQAGRVQVAVTEGAATYVESVYRQRHLGQNASRLDWAASREGRSPYGAFLVAPYVFGHRYVDRRVDSPADLPAVYGDPPRTAEQLLHADGDPPRHLTVAAETDDRWTAGARRTKGELFARLVLERHVDPDRAARAAAGWGADRVLPVAGDGGARGHAWVTRWDDAGEAEAFAATLRAALSARGERGDGGWVADGDRFRVVEPADDVVVLLAGDDAFVGAAAVAADGETVTVTVGEDAASAAAVAAPGDPATGRSTAGAATAGVTPLRR